MGEYELGTFLSTLATVITIATPIGSVYLWIRKRRHTLPPPEPEPQPEPPQKPQRRIAMTPPKIIVLEE